MGYDTEIAKLSRLSNGYEIEIYDPSPEEVKAEDKAAKKGDAPMATAGVYKNPWRTMAFGTFDEAIEFLEEHGKDLKPRNFDEDYAESFNKTVTEMDEAEAAQPKPRGKVKK